LREIARGFLLLYSLSTHGISASWVPRDLGFATTANLLVEANPKSHARRNRGVFRRAEPNQRKNDLIILNGLYLVLLNAILKSNHKNDTINKGLGMATYKKENAETEGKEASQNVVNVSIMQIVNHLVSQEVSKVSINGLSFPSEFAKQENALQKDLEVFGDLIVSNIDGIERNPDVYTKALHVIPKGMQMLPCMEFKKVLELENQYDWIWADFCGNAVSGELKSDSLISQFIQSGKLLKEFGIMFFTCRVFPRTSKRGLTAEEQYKLLSGEELETVSYYKMVDVYKQIIGEALGKNFKVFSTVIYPSTKGNAYVMIGVSKGWNPKEVHLNLMSKPKRVLSKQKRLKKEDSKVSQSKANVRSNAGKKAAVTRKANALAKKRSEIAKKAWATRRANAK